MTTADAAAGPSADLTKDVVLALSALAHETRLTIFRALVQQGPAGHSPGELVDRLGLANATLSFHLKELSRAGLITATPQGRSIRYAADFAAMNALLSYLTENCCVGSGCPPGKATLSDCRASQMSTCTPTPKSRRKSS